MNRMKAIAWTLSVCAGLRHPAGTGLWHHDGSVPAGGSQARFGRAACGRAPLWQRELISKGIMHSARPADSLDMPVEV